MRTVFRLPRFQFLIVLVYLVDLPFRHVVAMYVHENLEYEDYDEGRISLSRKSASRFVRYTLLRSTANSILVNIVFIEQRRKIRIIVRARKLSCVFHREKHFDLLLRVKHSRMACLLIYLPLHFMANVYLFFNFQITLVAQLYTSQADLTSTRVFASDNDGCWLRKTCAINHQLSNFAKFPIGFYLDQVPANNCNRKLELLHSRFNVVYFFLLLYFIFTVNVEFSNIGLEKRDFALSVFFPGKQDAITVSGKWAFGKKRMPNRSCYHYWISYLQGYVELRESSLSWNGAGSTVNKFLQQRDCIAP